jgi:amino acid adenylation domain-containing protein
MQATIDNLEDIYELSPMQEGMLFHTLQAPSAGLYVEQLVCTIRGALDRALFARAWQLVVDRHPVLRTAFLWEGLDRPRQVVRRTAPLSIDEHDWRDLSEADRRDALNSLVARDRQRGFALDHAPLMRLTLARAGSDRTVMIWSHHHLLLDGWSVPIVLQEAATAYGALQRGDTPRLPDRRLYRDYIIWLRSRDRRAAEAAWRAELGGIPAATPSPLARPTAVSGAAIDTELRLTAEETHAIDAFNRANGLTLNTTLLGAWALLLGAYAGEDDVVCGSSVSGRPADLEGADAMVGLFINSLPVRVRIDPGQVVSRWLRDLQARQALMRQHDTTPLVDIQTWLGVRAGTSLFDSLLVVVNYPVDAAIAGAAGGLTLEAVHSVEQTSVPLTIFAVPGERLAIKLTSDRHRYDAETLATLAVRLRTMLLNVVADGMRPVGDVPLVGADEARAILGASAGSQGPALRTQVLLDPAHVLFEARAAEHPDATALMLGHASLTYRELNERANRLARHLRTLGAGPGVFVGLAVDRTFDMAIGMLGILKTGAAYVPVDPSFPAARAAFMLDCANVAATVTTEAHAHAPWAADRRRISLERDADAIAQHAASNLDVAIDPESIAYVMFTSGSTGTPKGAAIRHGALSNLLQTIPCRSDIAPDDRMAITTTISFDLSVLELCLPLVSGAAMVIVDRTDAADGRRLQAILRDARVTIMQGTPSLWRVLLASGWDGTPRITMIAGGEPLLAGVAAQLLARGKKLWNLYGPTETTIYSTGREVSASGQREAMEPIGQPFPHQPHYVADHHRRLAPIGMAGELLIGGRGVASGYVNRSDLTADRFVPDPFGASPGARLYRTGDIVRVRANGELEFVGRNDFQVKLRGYRVEIGEIESVAEQSDGVRECIVLARSSDAGEPRLVAYVLAEQGAASFDTAGLRAAIRGRLPEYMVPSAFVVLDEFPRLGNGKADRKRLPDPGTARPDLHVTYEPPSGDLERQIAALWQDVLKIDRIGANDNFFDVGGHSLLAVRLFGKLRDTLGRDLALVDLFSYPTVRAMARFLSVATAPRVEPVATDAAAIGRERLLAQRGRRRDAGDPAQER